MNPSDRIGFLGGGNMAEAILSGLLATGHAPGRLRVGETLAERCRLLHDRHGVVADADNIAMLSNSDVVLLALKPQVLGEVLGQLREPLQAQKPLLVSIAAGFPLHRIRAAVGEGIPLVRCMPNTPALVGAGVSGLFADEDVDAANRNRAENLMQAVGPAFWVRSEDQIDAVTAISGSGPAYFFLFMEELQAAAMALGLEQGLSRRLALETAFGASKLARESSQPLADLREQVTSKGGTTAAALESFARDDLPGMLQRATMAARDRARELAAEAQ